MTIRIGAVILAAGTASRMGRQKLLLPLGNKPLLAHVFATVAQLQWEDSLVVVGEPRQDLAALGSQYGIRTIFNPNRLSGQASSVATAIAHLSGEVDGVIFLPGDQPLITTGLLKALISRFAESASNKRIVVPCYEGEYRSPVLFGSAWLPELTALSGDRGGRHFISGNQEVVDTVEWFDEHAFWDADTRDDYLRLVQYLHKHKLQLMNKVEGDR
jgi:molybdenum cofactor cytidylyltransferase